MSAATESELRPQFTGHDPVTSSDLQAAGMTEKDTVGLPKTLPQAMFSPPGTPSDTGKAGRVSIKDAPPAEDSQSLFERLGGSDTLMAAITMFYDRMYFDDKLKHWFKGVNRCQQAQKMLEFCTVAFGGGHSEYSGKDMFTAKDLVAHGLDDKAFDAFLAHMVAVLTEMGVNPELITECRDIFQSTRNAVLGRAPP